MALTALGAIRGLDGIEAQWDLSTSDAPGNASWANDSSGIVEYLKVSGNQLSRVPAAIRAILGYSRPGLYRKMPLAHPAYPWMHAQAIRDVVGIGAPQNDKPTGLYCYDRV